jgi:hypothetical protein
VQAHYHSARITAQKSRLAHPCLWSKRREDGDQRLGAVLNKGDSLVSM